MRQRARREEETKSREPKLDVELGSLQRRHARRYGDKVDVAFEDGSGARSAREEEARGGAAGKTRPAARGAKCPISDGVFITRVKEAFRVRLRLDRGPVAWSWQFPLRAPGARSCSGAQTACGARCRGDGMGRWCHCRRRHRHGWVRGPPASAARGIASQKAQPRAFSRFHRRRGPWRRGPEPWCARCPRRPAFARADQRSRRCRLRRYPHPPRPPRPRARPRAARARGAAPTDDAREDVEARVRGGGCHRRRRRGRRRRGRPRSVERRDVHERAERAERAETQASEEEQRRLQRGGDRGLDRVAAGARGEDAGRRRRRRRANSKTILENVARRREALGAATLRLRVHGRTHDVAGEVPFARDATRAKDRRESKMTKIAREIDALLDWYRKLRRCSISTTRC